MYTAASYIQYPNGYPSFLSYARNHHYLNDSVGTNTSTSSPNSTHLLSHLNNIKQIQSDNEDDNQSLSPSLGDDLSSKKRSRTIPAEEKDVVYYEKRARNNESAKRSRDTRRIKEQEIQDRATFFEHENSRLSRENQTIRHQLAQLHALYSGISKPLQ